MNAVLPPPADDLSPPDDNLSPPTAHRPAAERWIVVLGVAVAVVFSAVILLAVRLQSDGARRVRLFDPASGDFRGFALPEPFAAAAIDLATADGGRFRLADARGKAVLLFFGYTRCPDVCPQTLAKLTAALAELGDAGGAVGDAEEQGRSGDAADDVVTVFATVDPSHDTADVVRQYLADFDARIVGLVGSEAELAALAADYDVAFGPPPSPAPGLMPPAAHGAHDAGAAGDAPTSGSAHGHGDSGATADLSGPAAAPTSPAAPELAHSSTVFLIDAAGRLRVVLGAEASPADIAHDVRAVLASNE